MKHIAAFLFAASLVSPAYAEPKQYERIMTGIAPEALSALIETTCVNRGFAVRRMSGNDVICQAGELDRKEKRFVATKPPSDPEKRPQVYHRFVTVPVDGGTLVKERTTMLMRMFDGNMLDAAVNGRFYNERIDELLSSIPVDSTIN